MTIRVPYVVLLFIAIHTNFVRADIFRWDNRQVIPGTEGITPGPGVQLDHRELGFANLRSRNLTDSNLSFSNLANADLYQSTLTNANLTGAVVTGTNFDVTKGFTKDQLYSTQSYQVKNLRGIGLAVNDLTGSDFAGQDLANANLTGSTLTNANLTGANLANANLNRSMLTNANLTGAVVTGTGFGRNVGFTKDQLYSTRSYQEKNLREIRFDTNNLTGWDFAGQNLTNAFLGQSTLENANLTGANLANANLLYSSLANANLTGANLANARLVAILDSTIFSAATVYNQSTNFPGNFDPVARGLTFTPSAPGDLDGDVGLTVSDVELLGKKILNPGFMSWQFAMFDLNTDSAINASDQRTWVVDLKKTWFGDANVDGQFNSGDLVQVFQAGQYEDDQSFNSTWSTGDWNVDGDFTMSDLVVAFQDGGYEAGPRAGVAAVPEPASWMLLIWGWLSLGILRRRKVAAVGGTSGELRRFGFRAHQRERLAVRGEEFEPRYCLSAVAFAAHDIECCEAAAGAESVYAADVDGDADIDVLSASSFDYKIAWYENTDGQGTFGDERVITTDANAGSVYAADVDGDGDVDVLSDSYWYENTDGKGTFSNQRIISTEAFAVYAADVDGDGDVDVFSAAGNNIAWYENTDGQGTFGNQRVITTEVNQAESVYATDVDGDGDVDVLSASYGDSKIAWYENTDGQGTFGDQRVITTEGNGAQSVYAADVDSDGDVDVLSASRNSNGGKIAWYENTDGQGTFVSQRVINTQGFFESVYAADVDDDGDVDVLSADGTSKGGKIVWYENTDGKGTFEQRTIFRGLYATSVYAADVDGDGDVDALSAGCCYGGSIAWYEQRPFGDSNGDGLFNSSDLLLIFQAGKYEDGIARSGTFAEGDWNGDQEFDSADLVLAFQLGHYQPAAQAGKSEIAAAVDRLFANPDATRFRLTESSSR